MIIKSKKVKIEELTRKIELANIYKKKLVNLKENLNYRYNQGLISDKKYYSESDKSLKGKTLEEWLNYYDDYISNAENKISKLNKTDFNINKNVLSFILIILFLSLGFFLLKPSFTTYSVKDTTLLVEGSNYFTADESPEFNVKILDKKGDKITGLAILNLDLGISLVKPNGEEIKLEKEVKKTSKGFNIKLEKEKAFRAGLYKLILKQGNYFEEKEFQWGLISLNSKKSIYKPKEKAEFIIVVLDKEGHAVSNADIELKVTDPNNEIKILFSNNEILETDDKGVYKAFYLTGIEGKHLIDIKALIRDIEVNFSTDFLVKKDYEFDIIRNAQSKIDPTKENSFNVRIDIESFIDVDNIGIKEYLPKEFSNINTDAVIEKNKNEIVLIWNRDLIDGKTFVEYSYSVPDIWPYLYSIGPVELIYKGKTFREARPWFIAVDPVTTYDFTGIVNPSTTHNATYGVNDSLGCYDSVINCPGTFYIETEFDQDSASFGNNYTNIEALNDADKYASLSQGIESGGYALHKFKFRITENEFEVTQIDIWANVTGGGLDIGANYLTAVNISIWESKTNVWENLFICEAGISTVFYTWCYENRNITTNIINYIDTNNDVFVLVQSNLSYDGGVNVITSDIYTDYVSLNVTYGIPPNITSPNANETSISQNDYFCLNVTVDDNVGVSTVLAEVSNTTGEVSNNTMIETSGSCSGGASDNVFGVDIQGVGGTGNYTFLAVFANDTSDNINYSDFADINITVTSANTVPNDPSPTINSTDGSNQTLQDLNVEFTPSDNDAGEVLTYNITWYTNNISNFTIGDISATNGTITVAVLDDANTTKGELWSAEVTVCDDEISCSNAVNTSQLEILNTAPSQVTLSSPEDGNVTTDRTPTLTWNAATDDDSDAITYTLYVLCQGGCASDNREIASISGTSQEVTPDLLFLGDNNYYYNWSVASYDGTAYGANSTERNITIQSIISITLPVDNVTFGSKNVGDADDTTDDNPAPVRVNNDGNARVNVTVSSSDALWTTQALGTTYFRFKVDNWTDENNSFIWAGSTTTFANVATTSTLAFNELNYTDATDEAEIDLEITVPTDEPPGFKESELTITASLSE